MQPTAGAAVCFCFVFFDKLLRFKLDVEESAEGITVLPAPHNGPLHDAVMADDAALLDVDAFRQLIAQHKDAIDAPGALGFPPLHLAVHKKRPALAEALLDAGADVNAATVRPDESLLSALHLAARAGDAALCELLLARGANASAVASILNTPLHMAAGWGAGAEIVRQLIAAGANVTAQDLEGYTALHLSVFAHAVNPDAALAQIRVLNQHCNAACAELKTAAGLTALQIATEQLKLKGVIVAELQPEPALDVKTEL